MTCTPNSIEATLVHLQSNLRQQQCPLVITNGEGGRLFDNSKSYRSRQPVAGSYTL